MFALRISSFHGGGLRSAPIRLETGITLHAISRCSPSDLATNTCPLQPEATLRTTEYSMWPGTGRPMNCSTAGKCRLIAFPLRVRSPERPRRSLPRFAGRCRNTSTVSRLVPRRSRRERRISGMTSQIVRSSRKPASSLAVANTFVMMEEPSRTRPPRLASPTTRTMTPESDTCGAMRTNVLLSSWRNRASRLRFGMSRCGGSWRPRNQRRRRLSRT